MRPIVGRQMGVIAGVESGNADGRGRGQPEGGLGDSRQGSSLPSGCRRIARGHAFLRACAHLLQVYPIAAESRNETEP